MIQTYGKNYFDCCTHDGVETMKDCINRGQERSERCLNKSASNEDRGRIDSSCVLETKTKGILQDCTCKAKGAKKSRKTSRFHTEQHRSG